MKKDLALFAALCGLTAAAFAATPDDGSVLSFGGSQPLKTNARVIAASNRDLQQAVHEGRFRSDLYHRLSVFPIHLPPLRERREDIPLAAYLVMRKAARMGRKIERIPNKIVERLMDYAWPENVRELENVWSAQSSFLPARRSVRRGFCIAHSFGGDFVSPISRVFKAVRAYPLTARIYSFTTIWCPFWCPFDASSLEKRLWSVRHVKPVAGGGHGGLVEAILVV